MLKLYKYVHLATGSDGSTYVYQNNCIAVLGEASNVKLTQELNSDYTLDFDYPYNLDKAKDIKENYRVECEGQIYQIMKISYEKNGRNIMHVSCMHIFHAKLRSTHIQSFGGTQNTIGKPPRWIMARLMEASKYAFRLIGDDKLEELCMTGLGEEPPYDWNTNPNPDGFKIDFDVVDKTTPYDIIQQIIVSCGKGELYIDNNRCALVERIGTDNGVRLDISHNMQNVTIERDISNMITRLYPYGKDDAHIGSVNNNKQYIDSNNVQYDEREGYKGYGIKEGYKDYSDYTEPEDILAHAQWEFDPDNEDRIDVPDINITGSIIDLSKLADGDMFKIGLGDKVRVIDGGTEYVERIIKIERYPYEPIETAVSIGRVKKDLFFYLQQMGLMTKRYNRNSTSNGKVSSKAIAGTLVTRASSAVTADTARIAVKSSSLDVSDGETLKCMIGSQNGNFAFTVNDNITAESVTIGNAVITVDDNGVLYINNKKILTEE